MLASRSSSSIRLILVRPTSSIVHNHSHQPTLLTPNCRYSSSKSTPTTTSLPDPPKKRSSYSPSPSPPPLPPKEQKEFISLINQSNSSPQEPSNNQSHPDFRNLGPEEFQGDVNPKTGEVNGPKRDPLKWPNEWGYGGRATDF
ncbi:hypothetical protein Pst134EA_025435 [Puccinia striiformis f. sp. tritici]|uniref:hypothetical protein n=1 Tax=Puccinia striiformis f. sp. tritici TaxID=168172 RepID=UPI002007B345|nr:hypothetical protein Pst134EA_025435 [Puccinia striiformis f. sp. tritici]KAH9451480.1 hypothetical protein Pst134EA_025435 [Puccinia striiformis f. sp. tritici]